MNIFPGFFGAIAASLKKLLKWNNDSILFGSLATGSNDSFGYSVAMNSLGDRIVVGAVSDERPGLVSNEGLAYVFVSGANGWTEQAILSGSLATVNFDAFGRTIAMNSAGDRIIIGASGDENISGSIDTGIAYIFISGANGWTEQQILSGSFATHTSDLFGWSVATNATGDRVIIGAPLDEGSGTTSTVFPANAYVFRLRDTYGDGWNSGVMQVRQGTTVVSALTMSSGAGPVNVPVTLTPGLSYNLFFSTAGSFPSELRVEIVDPNSTTIYNQTTAATVNTTLHTWTAVSGPGAVISTTSSLPDSSGLAYIFVSGTSGWSQQHILTGTLANASGDEFGYSVAINSAGDRVVVGAYNDERVTGSLGEGLAYIFVSGAAGWSQQQILSGTLATGSSDNFGYSVAMNANGDRIIVGAHQDERAAGTTSEGLAYIFVSGTGGWSQQQILSGTLATGSNDNFGYSVAMNSTGDRVIIGARQDERASQLTSQNEGLAYIFVSGASGWVQQQILSGSLAFDAGDNFGYSVTINSTGDRVIIGAVNDERATGATSEGLVYVYDSNITEIINNFSYSLSTNSIDFGDLGTASFPSTSSNITLNVPAGYIYSPMNDIVNITVSSSVTGTYTISPSTAVIYPAFGGINSNIVVNYSPNTSGQITGLVTFSASLGTASVSLTGSSTVQRFIETQILSGTLATGSSDSFGYSVATNASGDRIVVGAYDDERAEQSNLHGEGLVYIFVSGTSGWIQEQILSGTLATGSRDQFGYSVAMNFTGDRVIVGARQDERASQLTSHDEGLAYIFVSGASGWVQQQILSGSLSIDLADTFAESVAMNAAGDRVIVGARLDERTGQLSTQNEGLAYIFVSGTGGWSEQQILSGSLATGSSDNFGISVAINSTGDRVIVGAHQDERLGQVVGQNEGLAYIFVSGADGWSQQQILSGTLATGSSDQFGYSVAMNYTGDRVIVGARQDERTGQLSTQNEGLAYIFVSGASGWVQQQILSGTLATGSGDLFAYSVAINSTGDRVIVGAINDERASQLTSLNEGLAYIFVSGAGGWVQQQILSGSLATGSSDSFGYSVTIDSIGERVIIGAVNDERATGATSEGLAYIMDLRIL